MSKLVPTVEVLETEEIIRSVLHTDWKKKCSCPTGEQHCDKLIVLGDRLIGGALTGRDAIIDFYICILTGTYPVCLKVYALNYLRHPSVCADEGVGGVIESFLKMSKNAQVVESARRFAENHSVFSHYLRDT